MSRFMKSIALGLPIVLLGCTAPSGGGVGGGGGGSTEWSEETWAECEALIDAYLEGNASPEFTAMVDSVTADLTVEDAEYIAGLLTEEHSQGIPLTPQNLAYDPIIMKLQVDLHRGLVAGGYTGPTNFGLISDFKATFGFDGGTADWTLPEKARDAIQAVKDKANGLAIDTLVGIGTAATAAAEWIDGLDQYEEYLEPYPADGDRMMRTGAIPIMEGEIGPVDDPEVSFGVKRTVDEDTGESTYSVDAGTLSAGLVYGDIRCDAGGTPPISRWEACESDFTFTVDIDGTAETCPATYYHFMEWGSDAVVNASSHIEVRDGEGSSMACMQKGLRALADEYGWDCSLCGVSSNGGAVLIGNHTVGQPSGGAPTSHRTFAEVMAARGQ